LFNEAAASAQMPVNEAIDEVVDAAVIVELGGELGPLINEAAASARMPVDEPIDKAAARTWLSK
jgi:hypothetical protein